MPKLRSTARTLPGRLADEIGNWLLQPPIGGLGRAFVHGDRAKKQVALTYDDGPNDPSTNDILDVLAKHHVKATFFCVGVNALNYPEIVRRAYAESHIVANHSMYHSRKAGLLLGDDGHIDLCADVLSEIIGVQPKLYRAPWGWLTPWETRRLLQRGYATIGWDVYTFDWQVPPPPGSEIAAQAAGDVRPGSIILLHDGIAGIAEAEKPETARATDELIYRLREQGYEFLTIPEMLGIAPYAPVEHSPATKAVLTAA